MKRVAIVVFENLLTYQFFRVIYRFLHWSDRTLISVPLVQSDTFSGCCGQLPIGQPYWFYQGHLGQETGLPLTRFSFRKWWTRIRSNNYFITSSTGSPSSKYDHRHYCVTLEIQRKYKDLYRKKTYCFCNLRKWKDFNKNSFPYLKCVLRLSCVVQGPIYGRRFMGCSVNRPVDHTGETWHTF